LIPAVVPASSLFEKDTIGSVHEYPRY
jgi:hypothetical protein